MFDFTLPNVPDQVSYDRSCDSPKRKKMDTKLWGDYLTVTPYTNRRHSAASIVSQTHVRKTSYSLSDNEYQMSANKESTHFLHPHSSTRRSSSHSLTPEGSPLFSHPVQLPPLQINSSVSLWSSELAKNSTVSHIDEGEGVISVENDRTDSATKPKLLVGLQRVNIEPSGNWVTLPSHTVASVMKLLEPFMKNIGRPGEKRWSLRDTSFSRAVHERYFANPPTQSFPFSFCTSSFFGADKDQTLYSLMAEIYRTTYSYESDTSQTSLNEHSVSADIDSYKRYSWWHARLVDNHAAIKIYFSLSPPHFKVGWLFLNL